MNSMHRFILISMTVAVCSVLIMTLGFQPYGLPIILAGVILVLTTELSILRQKLKDTNHELTQAKDRLVETEKFVTLGEMVAGIAHEVNTPLGIAITAVSQLIEEIHKIEIAVNNNAISRAQLDNFLKISTECSLLLNNNLKRATSLIASFKQVSADQASEIPRRFQLKQYLEEIMLNISPLLKKTNISCHIDCPDELIIDSYPGIIFQIITIFVMNSLAHAFKPGDKGKIAISAHNDRDMIIIEYSDSGSGIPEENLNKIFEPFFTTKHGQGGTGLGLHIAYNRVIQLLKGTLTCKSTVGQGTTFTLMFPQSKNIHGTGSKS